MESNHAVCLIVFLDLSLANVGAFPGLSKRFANFFAKKLQKVVFSRHRCILHPLLCNVAPILMDSETLDENELGDRQANGTSMPMDSVTSSFWHEVRKGEPNTPLWQQREGESGQGNRLRSLIRTSVSRRAQRPAQEQTLRGGISF